MQAYRIGRPLRVASSGSLNGSGGVYPPPSPPPPPPRPFLCLPRSQVDDGRHCLSVLKKILRARSNAGWYNGRKTRTCVHPVRHLVFTTYWHQRAAMVRQRLRPHVHRRQLLASPSHSRIVAWPWPHQPVKSLDTACCLNTLFS